MMVDRPIFNVLGPLDVRFNGQIRELGGTKPRMLLATLLLHANRTVSTSLLVEVLWPHRRPRSAVENLRTYVSSLRSCLGGTGAPLDIRAQRSGYMITLHPDELDLLSFEHLVTEARGARAGKRVTEAVDLLCRALALWRGDPLADLPGSPLWDARLEPLAEARLTAAEELLAMRVSLGQYGCAIAELRGLVVQHPFREGLWRQLMLALHGSGRQAEALHAYTTIRDRLVEELGIEPGAELRQTHAAVLAGERSSMERSSAEGSPAERSSATIQRPKPYQLPPDVPDFTGRDGEAAALIEALAPYRTTSPRGRGTAPPAIAVVVGPAGVGKSALAVHCAHAVRDRYPDGQLYLDLGGTSREPADPGELLAEALRALGTADDTLPESVRERSALYRSLLAGRDVLIVLDDAAGADQVRPLLPGHGCTVLVTGRRRMPELPGARQVELDVLAPGEAEELLGAIVGTERLNREREAASAILRLCGYLPLSVRIVGARLAGRPKASLRAMERLLEGERGGPGAPRGADVEARGGYRPLPEDATPAYRALGTRGLPRWGMLARADDAADELVDVGPRRPVMTRPAASRPSSTVSGLTSPPALWEPEEAIAGQVATHPPARFDIGPAAPLRTVRPASPPEPDSAWGPAATLVPCFGMRTHHDAWRNAIELDAVPAKSDPHGEAALLRRLVQVYQDAYAESAKMFERSHGIVPELGAGPAWRCCCVRCRRRWSSR